MKKLFAIAVVFTAFNCIAQDVPAIVKAEFDKSFPHTNVKKWDKEDDNYEANFSKDGKAMSAVYDANGKWLETETDIAATALPAAIVTYIKEHYKGAAIKEAASLKTPNGERYEAEVKGVKRDLLFDGNGKFLKEEED